MSGGLIWITGFQGSGKTTLAEKIAKSLKFKGIVPILLDGDKLREALVNDDYSASGRKKLAFTYAKLGKLISQQGHVVIIATVSMFHDVRNWNRCENAKYCEIFLDLPMETLRQRDKKSLYSDAVINIDEYELPLSPDIVVNERESSQQECVDIVEKTISGWLEST